MPFQMSMILFSEAPSLSAAAIQAELASRWPDLPAASDSEEKENTIAFELGGVSVALGMMPAPHPWSDLEGPCATSILWPASEAELRPHKQHAIVTVRGERDPVALSSILTQVTAAIMATSPQALGAFWTNAALLVPKDMFIDFAVDILPNGPPLHIWVDFRVGRKSEHVSAGFTSGLAALGHMELEVLESSESPAELRERFMALAGYLLEHGPVIGDGDTLGEDANATIRVEYAGSDFGIDGNVMRLVYEPIARKSWWRRQ